MSGSALPRGDTIAKSVVETEFAEAFTGPLIRGRRASVLVGRSWRPVVSARRAAKGLDEAELVAMWSPAPPGSRGMPSLQLFRARLQDDMLAAHWLQRFATAMGYGIHKVETVSPAIADGLVSFAVGASGFTGRLAVRLYGPDVLVVLSADLAERYAAMAEVLALLVRGVSVEGLEPLAAVEGRRRLGIGGGLRFEVPLSWHHEAITGPRPGWGGLDLLKQEQGMPPVARIRLKWKDVGGQTDEVELAKMRHDFSAAGFVFGKRSSHDEPDSALGPVARLTRVDVHPCRFPAADFDLEAQFLALTAPGLRLWICALGPDRAAGFRRWAHIQRVLSLIGETMTQ